MRETKDANRRIQQLERDLIRKEKALAEAAALMILGKKVDAIWGGKDGEDQWPLLQIARRLPPSSPRPQRQVPASRPPVPRSA